MKGLIGLFSVLATINTTTPNSITEASIDITEMNDGRKVVFILI